MSILQLSLWQFFSPYTAINQCLDWLVSGLAAYSKHIIHVIWTARKFTGDAPNQ